MFEHIRSEALDNFKRAFNSALKEGHGFAAAARDVTNKSMGRFEELCEDATSKQVNWDSAEIRGEFSDDMVTHISKVRDARLPELTKVYESNIKKALSCNHVEAQLEVGNDDTWPAIIFHLRDITETVVSKFSFALSSLDVDQQEKDDKILKLKSYARRQVEKKAKTKAGQVLGLMKDRFEVQFNHDDNSMPRRWTDNDNISARTKTARTSCLKLLSVLAAIRLDEYKTDTIWETLVHSLVEGRTDTTTSHDPLASNTWEKIPAADTLITPVQCKSFWDEFQRQTEHIIKNARDSQKAYIIKKKLANLAVKIPLVALRVVLGVAALATGDPVSAVEAVSEIPGLISDMSN
ncbi:hypothetical protein HanIR_Chr12g0564011 [Helianthus annuus]|nr:hypothetical protein HanIR_Chr12g0564011 [Helianthus annuus]